MSTRAQVDITHRNKKTYRFWIYRDGYPTGVVPDLPDDDLDFEEVRRTLRLGDDPESMPDYYYTISLADRTIEIYHADFESKPWKRGKLLFSGTFTEAKQAFQEHEGFS